MRTSKTLRRIIRSTVVALVAGAFVVPVAQARLDADTSTGSGSVASVSAEITSGLAGDLQPVAKPESSPVTDGLGREIQPVPVDATVSVDDDGFAWGDLAVGLGIGFGVLLLAAIAVAVGRRSRRPQPAA